MSENTIAKTPSVTAEKITPELKHCSLNLIYSERDVSGNCYWAFTLFDHETQKTVCGSHVGGESNLRGIEFALRDRWPYTGEPRWSVNVAPMKKREFNRLTKDWQYAGCGPDEMLVWIRKEMNKEV